MTTRRLALLVFLICLGAFALSTWAMSARIAAFNEQAAFVRFHAEPVVARVFRLEGWPEGTLTDRTDELGRSFLELTYGGKSTWIPVKTPPAKDLPNLSAYDECVKVLAFNQVEAAPDGSARAVPGTTRLWIVTRNTPTGYDPDAWGSVRKSEWVFTFHELLPDGTLTIEQRRWPRGYMGERTLQSMAAEAARSGPSAPVEQRRAAELAKIEPLKERSPEYFAAMHVIPKINVPQYKFEDTALQFSVLGWTIPVSGFSMLGALLSLGFAFAPPRPTAESAALTSRQTSPTGT